MSLVSMKVIMTTVNAFQGCGVHCKCSPTHAYVITTELSGAYFSISVCGNAVVIHVQN